MGLPPHVVGEVFPFHLVLDDDLRMVGCGSGLLKLCPKGQSGEPFEDYFRLTTPRIPLDFKAIHEQAFTVFFVDCIEKSITLKGQMVRIASASSRDEHHLIFLCSPVVRDLRSVKELGLTLNDFPMHDSSVEHLMLIRAKAQTIEEIGEFAERLRGEIAVRVEAETKLMEANHALELRVAERTRELESANQGLERENLERKKIEEQVCLANNRLSLSNDHLKRRNREISLLNRMGENLQACVNTRDTYEVVAAAMPRIFPHSRGQLCLSDERGHGYRVVATWGDLARPHRHFDAMSCRALRERRPFSMTPAQREAEDSQPCGHLTEVPEATVMCAPFTSHDEPFGLLHIQIAQPDSIENDASPIESRQQLALTAAEHVGLAISNLRLRETLRNQALCDPLTGLYNRRYMQQALRDEMARALQSGACVTVLMIDVDHFKKFNDTHGHQVGDGLLRDLGKFLHEKVRGEDIACRYGGEEFILILPGTPLETGISRADSIRREVESRRDAAQTVGAGVPWPTVSIGAAAFPEHGEDAETIVRQADRALYDAKAKGRNLVVAASSV